MSDVQTGEESMTDAMPLPPDHTVCVFYEHDPLVLVDVPFTVTATELLDWYAEKYAFERRKLTVCIVDKIKYER